MARGEYECVSVCVFTFLNTLVKNRAKEKTPKKESYCLEFAPFHLFFNHGVFGREGGYNSFIKISQPPPLHTPKKQHQKKKEKKKRQN